MDDRPIKQTPAAPESYWWRPVADAELCALPARPAGLCPRCGRGRLEYDALFRLVCTECGYSAECGGYT